MPDNYTTEVPSVPWTPLQPATPTVKPITQSILLTIKKMLGIAEEYHAFDLDVIININSVFLTLSQLGVGPSTPYQITGTDETWSDFLGDQESLAVGVQTYVYLKTRLLFDPPTNSFLVDSMQKQIQELEWRLNIQVDHPKENQNGSSSDIDMTEMSRERVREIYEQAKTGDPAAIAMLASTFSANSTTSKRRRTPKTRKYSPAALKDIFS